MKSRGKVRAKTPPPTGKKATAAKKSKAASPKANQNALRDFGAASTNAPRDVDAGQRSFENNPRAVERDVVPSRRVAPRRG